MHIYGDFQRFISLKITARCWILSLVSLNTVCIMLSWVSSVTAASRNRKAEKYQEKYPEKYPKKYPDKYPDKYPEKYPEKYP